MPEPLKSIYTKAFFEEFTTYINHEIPYFDSPRFIHDIFSPEWNGLELKERMHHISNILHKHLCLEFPNAINHLIGITEKLKASGIAYSFEYMFIPDYIEQYGQKHFEISMEAMQNITRFTSCEFAVRPFILQNPNKSFMILEKWTTHSDETVRRLASEGCRPRLPWANALPFLKKDPSPILAILETLKNDPSEFVRRSVANNLNDISKDNPDVVINIIRAWKGHSKNTDRICKHASRTLLKAANAEILGIYGYGNNLNLTLNSFTILAKRIAIGESIGFTFSITNNAKENLKMRLEYAVYFLKSNGTHHRKIFQISEREIAGKQSLHFERKQSFKEYTTRKLYRGLHKIALIINGQEQHQLEFEVI